MFMLPDDFMRTIMELHGEPGQLWLERLPTLLADCEKRWGIEIGAPFAYASCHYVAPARQADGTEAVIKVHSPTGEFAPEMAALRHYNGHGAVQLLDYDQDNAILLLERLRPGNALIEMEDDEAATACAASVMRKLWRPVPEEHDFETVADWGRGLVRLRQHFNSGTGPIPTSLVEEAETLFAELSASAAESVVLHGDLHHENILAAEREPWLAIDPKGLIGEPAYETGARLRNPYRQVLQRPDPGRILARRIDQFADELSIERARIRGWGLYQAVLSAWWSIEDFGHVEEAFLRFAQLLAAIN